MRKKMRVAGYARVSTDEQKKIWLLNTGTD
jgi:hypothetical protein